MINRLLVGLLVVCIAVSIGSVFAEPSDRLFAELCDACNKGRAEQVARILTNRMDLTRPCPQGAPPLNVAALRGRPHIVTLLLSHGADPNLAGDTHNAPLIDAVRGHRGPAPFGAPDQAPAIVELLIRHGADVNGADQVGFTALMWAAETGDLEMVLLLVQNGANINAATRFEQRTALSLARKHRHLPVVKTLLDLGAKD